MFVTIKIKLNFILETALRSPMNISRIKSIYKYNNNAWFLTKMLLDKYLH